MRPLMVVLTAAALLACGAAASAQQSTRYEENPQFYIHLPSDSKGAMEHARARVAANDLNGAIEDLRAYVIGHPGEPGPERLLGDLYFRQGDMKKAEDTYLHIISYDPGDKETHSRLGSVYATENRIDDAIREYNRSLPGTDSVPDLVQLHLRKGDFGEYEAQREDAARTYPSDAEAQLELGQVYEVLHQEEMAIRYFRLALQDDAYSILAMNGLGLSYLDMRDYDLAEAQFETCLSIQPNDYACEDNLGAAYLEAGRDADAAKVLNLAHRMAPERSEALVNLGYLADVKGDWKKAVAFYVQAMTVYPYSPDAYIDLGVAYNAHGLYQLAQAALIKGLAVAPMDGRLHYLLGDAYEHEGNAALAEEQYRAAAGPQDIDPDVRGLAQQRVAALQTVPSARSTP